MSQILGIKFSDHGPVCYFASGAHVLQPGQHVLVETDQGQALGRVATVKTSPVASGAASGGAAAAAPEALQPEATQPEAPQPAPFEDSFSLAPWDEVLPEDAPGGMPGDFSPGENGASADAAADWPPAPAPDTGDADSEQAGDAAQSRQGSSPVALFASDQAAAQPIPENTKGLETISRLATEGDLEIHAENRRLARRAFGFCRGCISSQNLDMKLVDVEVLHDRSKMIFFFTAPNRIDFRELIKSLVREFHTRIELRQIGVRHETQMIGAIGNCGQVCCCRRFLRRFAPVTIKMAKEQNLFLNPAKISGICGRLLCCLSYEQKGYEEFHKQCPKIGKRVQTPLGSMKILRANFFKKSISVWLEEGGEREFTLDEWKEMLNRQPGDAPAEPKAESQASEGQGRQGRGSGRVSTGRPARPERGPRPDNRPDNRPDRPERSDRAERGEKGERGERPERTERSDKPERPSRPDRPDRSERGERGERPARPERSDRPERHERAEAEAQQGGEAHAPHPGEGHEGDAPAGEGRERSRPRRKRRKSRGPKPAQ